MQNYYEKMKNGNRQTQKAINRQNIGNKEKRNGYGGSKEVQRGATDHK